jgi:site-specific recombinase XerD
MDPGAPNPLLRSFERHLRAENRSDQTVATYLIALRQAEAFLTGSRGTTLAQAGRADLEAFPEVVRLRTCHRDGVNHSWLDHAAADGSLGTMIHIAT